MRSLTFDLRFRLGRTLALAALLGLAVPGLLVPRAAQAEPEQTSARKFQRGLAGLTLAWLEIPGNIGQEGQTNGALLGLTVGLGVGLGKALVRTLVGAYELLSAPFPAPAGFEPMLQPEFPWEYFDSEPGRPYGFEATYLAKEEGALKRIPGANYLSLLFYEFNEVTLLKIVGETQEVVIYSSYGEGHGSAARATAQAVSWGFKKIYYFRDGLDGWKAAGYPVDTEKR